MGPSAPPAPEPIEFLRISNDSGGIPHPESAQKSQKYAEYHGFHIFPRDFEKITEIHHFLWISHFGVAEPSGTIEIP